MWGVLYRLYYRFRKKEMEKAKIKLKKMKIDTILQCLTKECWKYGIQYEILLKTNDMFYIKLLGRKKTVLMKYHNTDMVFADDFNKFIYDFEGSNASRGVYITSGVFEHRIVKIRNTITFNRKITICDNTSFIISQLGFKGSIQEVFVKKKLKFFDYFPV